MKCNSSLMMNGTASDNRGSNRGVDLFWRTPPFLYIRILIIVVVRRVTKICRLKIGSEKEQI